MTFSIVSVIHNGVDQNTGFSTMWRDLIQCFHFLFPVPFPFKQLSCFITYVSNLYVPLLNKNTYCIECGVYVCWLWQSKTITVFYNRYDTFLNTKVTFSKLFTHFSCIVQHGTAVHFTFKMQHNYQNTSYMSQTSSFFHYTSKGCQLTNTLGHL